MHALSRAEKLIHLALLVLALCALATAAGALLFTGTLNAIAALAIAAGVACVPLGLTIVTAFLQPEADRLVAGTERAIRAEADSSPEQAPLRRAA